MMNRGAFIVSEETGQLSGSEFANALSWLEQVARLIELREERAGVRENLAGGRIQAKSAQIFINRARLTNMCREIEVSEWVQAV